MKHGILHLGVPTPGDKEYYSRWEKVGDVFLNFNSDNALKITIIICDQYFNLDSDFISNFPNLMIVCSPTTGHTHLKFDPIEEGIRLITLRDRDWETRYKITI